MATPLINGVQHSWASIILNVLGRNVVGVTGITYGDEREMENHYGAGDEPVSRGTGNKVYSGASIKLYQWEVVAIQQACGGDLTSIPPFDIPVHYKATANAGAINDVVQNVQFLKNTRDWKQGDKMQEVQLDIIHAGVKWHSI
jgi:hypothetical protein